MATMAKPSPENNLRNRDGVWFYKDEKEFVPESDFLLENAQPSRWYERVVTHRRFLDWTRLGMAAGLVGVGVSLYTWADLQRVESLAGRQVENQCPQQRYSRVIDNTGENRLIVNYYPNPEFERCKQDVTERLTRGSKQVRDYGLKGGSLLFFLSISSYLVGLAHQRAVFRMYWEERSQAHKV